MNSIQHSVAMYAGSLLRDFVAQQYNNNSLTLMTNILNGRYRT